MAEETEAVPTTIPEKAENVEELPEKSENEETTEPPAPKKRGRPVGSKDTAPRRPRTKIVEEPPTPPPEPEAVPKPKPRQARAKAVEDAAPPSAPAPPPLSPRSVFRHTSDQLSELHAQKEAARRAYWADAINRTLR